MDAYAPDEQLAARAAWLYFVGGLTQAQTARKLGLNRIRVNRLLAQARAEGIVQIRITGKLAACVELEQALVARFGLDQAIVVPTPPDRALVSETVAAAAGAALAGRLEDGMSVGVGWGRTLRLSLRSVPHRPMKRLSVVSLLGGLTRGAAMNPHETASHLADLLDAQCYYVAAPALADSEETRDLLMAQPMIEDVLARGRKVDLAFVSVGALSASATMAQVGLLAPAEIAGLKRAGAVGDMCVHWIDVEGRVVDHPLNRRAVSLSPERLKEIPCVIIASGGRPKVPALLGALNGGMADVLVTDEEAAQGVLRLAGS